jgi:5-formyltetrahydrofolate cyclo-ligase
MTGPFPDKQSAREAVWDRLDRERLAAFPFPPHGRIPNFRGARRAAQRLFELAPWRDARRIKVNPDSPQAHVREEALRRGIVVYVPTPRLTGGFKKLDPARIPPKEYGKAARRANWHLYAEEVPLAAMPQLDAIVAGSVAVTRDGRRAGKGAGYSDLEFAILRELGHRPVPVATTVHAVQIVEGFPSEPNDLPLAAIATPEETITIDSPPPAPEGIDWKRLSEQDLEAMPILRELRTLRTGAKGAAPGGSPRPRA